MLGQGEEIGAEDILDAKLPPEPFQLGGGLTEGPVMGGQECGVDGPRAHTRDDGDLEIRVPSGQESKDAHLIGGSGSSAPEGEPELLGGRCRCRIPGMVPLGGFGHGSAPVEEVLPLSSSDGRRGGVNRVGRT
jgi:hypothetical protein